MEIRHQSVAPTRTQRLASGRSIDAHRHDDPSDRLRRPGSDRCHHRRGILGGTGNPRDLSAGRNRARAPGPRPASTAPGRTARGAEPPRPGRASRTRRQSAAARGDHRLPTPRTTRAPNGPTCERYCSTSSGSLPSSLCTCLRRPSPCCGSCATSCVLPRPTAALSSNSVNRSGPARAPCPGCSAATSV